MNEEADAGEIISQSALDVIPDQPFADLMDRVFRSANFNLINALNILDSGGVPTVEREGNFKSQIENDFLKFDEPFWQSLK